MSEEKLPTLEEIQKQNRQRIRQRSEEVINVLTNQGVELSEQFVDNVVAVVDALTITSGCQTCGKAEKPTHTYFDFSKLRTAFNTLKSESPKANEAVPEQNQKERTQKNFKKVIEALNSLITPEFTGDERTGWGIFKLPQSEVTFGVMLYSHLYINADASFTAACDDAVTHHEPTYSFICLLVDKVCQLRDTGQLAKLIQDWYESAMVEHVVKEETVSWFKQPMTPETTKPRFLSGDERLTIIHLVGEMMMTDEARELLRNATVGGKDFATFLIEHVDRYPTLRPIVARGFYGWNGIQMFVRQLRFFRTGKKMLLEEIVEDWFVKLPGGLVKHNWNELVWPHHRTIANWGIYDKMNGGNGCNPFGPSPYGFNQNPFIGPESGFVPKPTLNRPPLRLHVHTYLDYHGQATHDFVFEPFSGYIHRHKK